MANNFVVDGTLRVAGGLGLFGTSTTATQPAATAQSAVASTTITSVGSTSLTALDVTRLNALIDRVEAIRVLEDSMRTALVNTGIMKGSA